MATVKKWFITGIGTGIGKTFVSTILAQYLKADYWKPVQSGDLDCRDSFSLAAGVSYDIRIHPERYALQASVSPHQAAAMENITIHVDDFKLPETENHLIVEGAGGLFVPLNEEEYMIDLIKELALPVVLVIQDYLGCINHSVLSLEALRSREIDLAAVVFNGDFNPYTEDLLRKKITEKVPVITLPTLHKLTKEGIEIAAEGLHIA
ncbi:dethiobiotin synthase [Sphingobacterium oryzagri]|uniref:ATP-dependent dethiobiotin synthetase BioD n=1 Tax=Sphingobacterium oryzagri TaxID=3025669 RepID=A0ABY7WK21_9SPHI|nr:dethiobiotin synthase [Sphingobacterium sp. KACC 22765]WDF69934.1 dethiobiotin synthase [Sphingobacterium sp. KACC 22765]